MDNRPIAQVFGEIADLLEIKGGNAFKIRAYRAAAETIAAWPDPIARIPDRHWLDIPGIGKDLAAKIRELVDTGRCAYHQELLREFPATILELLRLPGVGPKTVGLLYAALNVRSVDDLATAARDGRLRALKGMGARKEALIINAIEARGKLAGRFTLPDAAAVADELAAYLRERVPEVDLVPVGSVRRGCDTCGGVDILAIDQKTPASGHETAVSTPRAELMEALLAYPRVERVLTQGDTGSSIRLEGGVQADVRHVPAESRGAALQYFTGSKAHNIALRDRAIDRGLKLDEYGLYRASDGRRVAGDTEEGIYEALGLSWIPPELREGRGEVEAAAQHALPRLVELADLRGDLHMHTTETDGRDSLEDMAAAAYRRGHKYIAITEHSKALAMANGLDESRALAHATRVRALNGRFEGMTLLAGIECDILADGTLDLADDCLAALDIVVASIHSHFNQDEARMTDRILRALECPWVDVLGHPTGRLLLRREPAHIDVETIATAAARHGVAIEINCQAGRLDLNDAHAKLALDRGASLVISTDAHSTRALENQQWGVLVARRAWATPGRIVNTSDLTSFQAALRRNAGSRTWALP